MNKVTLRAECKTLTKGYVVQGQIRCAVNKVFQEGYWPKPHSHKGLTYLGHCCQMRIGRTIVSYSFKLEYHY